MAARSDSATGLVVAGNCPIQRELEQVELAADRGEHRLAADAGGFGYRVDGRRPVTILDEEPGRGGHDGPPRLLRLGRPQLASGNRA